MIRPFPTGAVDSLSAYSAGITSVLPLSFSKAAMREKSLFRKMIKSIKIMVSHAYKFSGIVCRNKENPSIPLFSGREDDTAAAQLETGAIMQIGAAVASMIYASFARVILNLSVTGLITIPTVRQLK